MKLDDLLNRTSEWLNGTGPGSEIVVSSRIRLARNLEKLPFSHWANKKQQEEILHLCREAVEKSNYLKGAAFFELKGLSAVDRQFLVERYLISPEHAAEDGGARAVAVTENEMVSIMINEEDHLRLQVIQSGFDLREAWRVMEAIDGELEGLLRIAFAPPWGYLTSCPTNAGTGLRASVMLHLQGLVMTGQVNRMLAAIAKLNLNARGLYGEGTEASGNFFQISNQVALGQKETDIIDNIERVIRQIVNYEESSRRRLLEDGRPLLEDQVYRACGLLKNARIVSTAEAVNLLSTIRLGAETGLVKDVSRSTLNELFVLIQPAHLQKREGRPLRAAERDEIRAGLLRERLEGRCA